MSFKRRSGSAMSAPHKSNPAHAGGAFLLPCILTRCRAFFLPGCNTARYKRLQCVLPCQCNFTANDTKQRTGLCRGFSCDYTRSTSDNNRPAQAAIIPPATRWKAYTRPDTLNRYQIPPPRWDAAQVSTAAYYNNVYIRGQTVPAAAGQLLPCVDRWQVLTRCQQYRPGAPAEGSASPPVQGQPGEVSMLPAPGGWRSGTLHPAGQSSSRGAAGGAEPLAATAAALFGLSPDS